MTTVRRYVWQKMDGTYTRPHIKAALRIVAAKRIVWGKGPYSIKEDGVVVAKNLSKPKAVDRVLALVGKKEIGSVFRVWDAHGNIRLTTRAVNVNVLPTDSTNGNRNADAYYNWIVTHYKQFHPNYAGSYVCKDIAGTWVLSQHSYGNAVDFFFDSLTHQDIVARAVVANAGALNAYHVISRQQVWTKGEGWHSYTGDYHSHLHVDFDPQLSGSCGVRN